ncbi:MAG: secretion protein HlyD [Novosphingobium sp.]|nr:secretion protein HlyD [Novosphingobium sp.]
MNYDTRIDTAADGVTPDPFNPLDAVDDDERRKRRWMWIGLAVAAVVIIGLWMLAHRKDDAADLNSAAGAQTPTVTVLAPGRTTVSGRITATGTLAARRELPIGIAGEGGQVIQVLVQPGQWVRRGQVLAVIDRSVQVQQEASQGAQISVSRADAQLAQANLDRAQKLVARGFISKADIDRLTATRDAAVARVRVAAAQLGELQARTQRLNIVAPEAGLVLERKVEPGQVVSSGSGVLFSMAQGGEMEMLAQLSENDLAKIGPGVSADVTPVGSARAFTGQVWQVSPIIDPQTRLGRVRIALSYAPELRPGGFANAEVIAGSVVAPVLAESAVLSDNAGSYVYIVDGNNKVVRRPVKTGTITNTGVIILEGLTGSERVVERAGAFLQPGETVKPKIAPRRP